MALCLHILIDVSQQNSSTGSEAMEIYLTVLQKGINCCPCFSVAFGRLSVGTPVSTDVIGQSFTVDLVFVLPVGSSSWQV